MSSDLRFETASEEETRSLGRKLADILPECGTVLLRGALGAGKTTLAQGIIEGRGLARADDIASPTFTLIHEYGDPVRVTMSIFIDWTQRSRSGISALKTFWIAMP